MFDLRAQLSVSHYFDCYLYLFCFQPGVSFHSNKYSSAKQQQINYQRFTDSTGILPERLREYANAAFLYIFRDPAPGGGDVNCNADI